MQPKNVCSSDISLQPSKNSNLASAEGVVSTATINATALNKQKSIACTASETIISVNAANRYVLSVRIKATWPG